LRIWPWGRSCRVLRIVSDGCQHSTPPVITAIGE
jgi:hypothetical protein